jgi:CO/xanthine dehydrogenase Mo-binding subunit
MEIGKSHPVLDSVERVTGETPYSINLQLEAMLYAKVLRSPLPHAKILSIDTSAAEDIPGVVAVLTAKDFDQPGGPKLLHGGKIKDHPILAFEKVRFVGESVAMVAAETEEIAEAALDLIEVDYEELPGVYEEMDAISKDAPILHESNSDNIFRHSKIRHGDVEQGFTAADEIVEETYTSPVAQHVSLEPHMVAAQWEGDQVSIWTGSQSPYTVKHAIAEIFDMDPDGVRVIVPQLGGGYGGKAHLRIEPMVVALAWKLGGRPVKLTLTRAEEFVTVTKHAATITIKSGVKSDGTLTARKITAYWNAGAYAGNSTTLVRSGMVRTVGPYRIPAVHVDSYGVYTNLPSSAAFRGAMSSQTTWTYESHMDTIAHRLGMDPLEIRRKNMLCEGDTFATGQVMHDVYYQECLEATTEKLGWESRPSKEAEGVLKRGYGMAVMMKSSPANSRSEARIELDSEGDVTLFMSVIEMGQGAHTAMAQITADALEIPFERITVASTDTEVTPFESSTSSSRSTYMMGTAIRRSAEVLKGKILEAAEACFEVPAGELTVENGKVVVTMAPEQFMTYAEVLQRNELDKVESLAEFKTTGEYDRETGQGILSGHFHQGAGACEVEVDTETGKVRVLRYIGSSYAGQVVNPALVKLQNDGNVIYGLGPAVLEEMVFDHGQLINPNLSDYMVPSFLDIPEELHTLSLESEGGDLHGIGEMTLPSVAPAIGNAIYDAIGVRIRDLPITAEKVLRALNDDNS